MKMNNKFKWLACLLLAVTLSACQSINSGVGGYFGLDTDLTINFKVGADINPDERSKPSPLFIRMYEMQDTKMITKADFIDIYERDKEALGADMLAVQKLKRLIPGEDQVDHFVLGKKTLYVALYAEFLQYKNSDYLLIIPVTPNNVVATSITVEVSGNTLKVYDHDSDAAGAKETAGSAGE